MLYCSAEVGEGEKEKERERVGGGWPMLCLAEACTCCMFTNTVEVAMSEFN